MSRVLLLNPPGKRTYLRDYFCSKVAQADYVYHPIDLLILSGLLSSRHQVLVMDAIAERIASDVAVEKIAAMNPSTIITLMGAASWGEDIAFVRALKARLGEATIVAIGDVFLEDGERLLAEHSAISAILLNFTTEGILAYLAGDFGAVNCMIIRDASGKPVSTPCTTPKQFDLPVPRHDLFLGYRYQHPFIRKKQFATVLLDYGCPFPCSFCIMNALGYRTRTLESIKRELQCLHQLGISEILFISQTFGADNRLAEEVCRFMAEGSCQFSWVCFSRVDVATPALLTSMQQAGCHTIIFGIESGAEAILSKYRKGYTLPQILSTLEHCHAHGIETAGTFVLGLPEETHETMRQTLNLLKIIKLDYASFNVAVPRAGTELRQQALAAGLIRSDILTMDQSGSDIAMPTKSLSQEEIRGFRRKAVLTFYGRPGYLLRRIRKVKTMRDFFLQARQGLSLLRNTYLSSVGTSR